MFARMDASHLGFKNASFDIIIALEIIEHLVDPDFFLDGLKKVLKEGGILVISTPNRHSLEGLKGKFYEIITGKKWYAWDKTHKYIFSSAEFIKKVKSRFEIIEIMGYYYLPSPSLRILGPIQYMKISRGPLSRFGFDTIIICKNPPIYGKP